MSKLDSPHFPNQLQLESVVNHEAATVYFYGNIVVVEVKEGITLSYKNGFSLLVKGLSMLKAKPWIYVSNRINSYAVNPNDYKYLNKVPTLKGLAIVNNGDKGTKTENLEANFFKKPFIVVDNIEDAYRWGQEILDN